MVGDTLFAKPCLWARAENQFTLKIRHELTKNQQISGYYYFTSTTCETFARLSVGRANLPGFGI